ncbi:MAG: Spy/CpxP family protein refolding chaperone [Alistipes sp.]
MKKLILAVVFVLTAMVGQDVFAQNAKANDDAEKAKREQLMQTRLDMLKTELNLTNEQFAKFEPVYRAYRKEMSRVVDNKIVRVKKDELTNDNALKVINARLSNTISSSALKQRYLLAFAEVIEPLQIEKLYRIDERIAKEARKVVQYKK